MIKKINFTAVLALGLLSFGCDKKPSSTITIQVPDATVAPASATETLETKKLGAAIDRYVASPTAENSADVKKALADLDGEIAELESRVSKTTGNDRAEAQAKLTNLRNYRAKEVVRYNLALPSGADKMDTRTGAEKVESTLEKAGDHVKDTAERVGNSIERAAEKTGDKIKDATGN